MFHETQKRLGLLEGLFLDKCFLPLEVWYSQKGQKTGEGERDLEEALNI